LKLAIAELTCQSYELGINPPVSGVKIDIQLNSKHPRRGNLDNISASILDALVQNHILGDDSQSHIQGRAIALNWSEELYSIVIEISE
jgi:Holliday junction resolvase RusA-like endonuclease